MTQETKELGKKGERAAAEFLKRQGFELVEQNWKCSYGEVDIVALDGVQLVFVEVKTRKSLKAGIPEEAITPAKQKRYLKCARVYSTRNEQGLEFESIRFDAVAIYALNDERALLRYVRDAFRDED